MKESIEFAVLLYLKYKRVAVYKELFPTYLEADVTRACNYMFLTIYATIVCDMAKDKGLLISPPQDSVCDVLIQFK